MKFVIPKKIVGQQGIGFSTHLPMNEIYYPKKCGPTVLQMVWQLGIVSSTHLSINEICYPENV